MSPSAPSTARSPACPASSTAQGLGARARHRLFLGALMRCGRSTSPPPPLRELNAALHQLRRRHQRARTGRSSTRTGKHAVAVGLDAPVTRRDQRPGRLLLRRHEQAGDRHRPRQAGVGVAENMMSGDGARQGRRQPVGRRHRPRRPARHRRQRLVALRHLDEGHRHRGEGLGRPHERLHGAGRQPRRAAAMPATRSAIRSTRRGSSCAARSRASAPTASRSRCGRAPRDPRRRCSTQAGIDGRSIRPSSSATARRASSTTSTSTTPGPIEWNRTTAHAPHPRHSATFDHYTLSEIRRAAATGIYDIRGGGAKRQAAAFRRPAVPRRLDLRYPLEGYREKCGTDVVLGTRFAKKPIHLKIPITIAGMSFGSLSAQAKEALGRGASHAGTSTTTGDGGMTAGGARPFARSWSTSAALALRHEPGRPAQGRRHRDRRRPGRQARRRRHAARPEDLRARRRDAHAARGHRPALGLPPSRLDRPRRPRDQDRGAARDHRLGEADLRQGRRRPALLRHRAGGEGRRRRRRARRHAGRHGGDAGSVHRACRPCRSSPRSARRCRRCRISACTARCSSSSPAASATAPTWPRRWRSAPTRCRSARRRWSRSATTTRPRGRIPGSSAPPPAPMTTGTRAATRPASPRRTRSWPRASTRCSAGRRLANYLSVLTLEAQTIARACGKSHVHNLEPEDLVALTVEAAAMARVPLAGTNWIPGQEGSERCQASSGPSRELETSRHRKPGRPFRQARSRIAERRRRDAT